MNARPAHQINVHADSKISIRVAAVLPVKIIRLWHCSTAFFIIIFFYSPPVQGQNHEPEIIIQHKDSLIGHQIDVWDVCRYILGKRESPYNDSIAIKKGRVYVSPVPALGYSIQSSFFAGAEANITFCTDEPRQTNLSTMLINGEYSLKQQFTLQFESNVWTRNNKIDLVGDIRFYKYPSVTYGMGTHTTLADADPLDYTYLRVYQVAAKQFLPDLLCGIGYNLDYHYDIEDFGSLPGTETDIKKYDGGARSTISSGISLNMVYDARRNNNNPQGGWYGDVIIRPNLTILGSSHNWQLVYADFRKYFRLPGKSHNIISFWNYYWITIGHAPYLDLPATSWDTYENSARGYIQDRYKGPALIYFESEYRFSILNDGLLGGVVFTNFQSYSSGPSNTFTTVFPAVGTGLRIKVNKHSNTNACIDYAWGVKGANGVFFNLGEVF